VSDAALEAVERLLAEAPDADEVLRGTVSALVAEPNVVWAAIGFVEGEAVTLEPAAGTRDDARRTRIPIAFQGAIVGELSVDGEPDARLIEQVGLRIAPQVLIGWDTGGETWEP
jgi:hypothetical protein